MKLFKTMLITDTDLAVMVLKKLNNSKPVMCDTETENLAGEITKERQIELGVPTRNGIRLLQLHQRDKNKLVYIIDFDYVDIDVVKQYLKPLHTVWVDANFDFGCLKMTTDKFDDLKLSVRTAFPMLPAFTWDVVVKHLVKADIYKGLDKKGLQKKAFKMGSILSQTQLDYAAADVYSMGLVWTIPKIHEVMKLPFYKLDMRVLRHTITFQQNGALVDVNGVQAELDKLPKILAEENIHLGGVNSKSSKQVKEAFAKLGVISNSFGKPILIELITNGTNKVSELAKAIYDNRRTRLRKTNLEKLLAPKIYTRFNPYGTVTGRYSSNGKHLENGVNFQNITRDMQYLTEQDTEDTVVIHADYSTAEIRAACSIMGDNKMRGYLLDWVDIHKVSAKLADKTIQKLEDVTKAQRQKGKAVSFGFIFGMSWSRFKEYAYTEYSVKFTDKEAKEVKKAYDLEFPDIAKYHRLKWNTYKTVYAESPMGRKNKPNLGTDAINFSTQSCIGETCKIGVDDYCIKNGTDYIFSQIHDAILLRAPREIKYKQTRELGIAMLGAWDKMLKFPMLKFKDIPMEVEIEVDKEVFKFRSIKQINEWYRKVSNERV